MSDYSGDRKEYWSKMLNLDVKTLEYYVNG